MIGMDLDEVRRRVTAPVATWADEDIAVRVERTALRPVSVTVSSADARTCYTGRYRVLSQEQHGETTHVRLRRIGASSDRVGSDKSCSAWSAPSPTSSTPR